MFRRKEESLFDTTTEAGYAQPASAEGAASTAQPAAAPVSQASNNTNNSTSGSTGSSAPVSTSSATNSSANNSSGSTSSGGSTGGISRPLPDTRPVTSQSNSTFRPNSSSISADMSRNRMPETKAAAAPAANTVMEKTNKAGRRVLTVGNDILLKGEIATCDRLVIEGKVDATLNDVHTVEISENGSFKGSAQIEDAEISGLFEGDLIVRNRLVIYATGKVRGNITYGEIEIERGGELTGEIKTVSSLNHSNNSRPVSRPVMKDDKVAA